MTTIGKVLAVVVFFASVIFLAVASSVVATSYPWMNHTEDMTVYIWKQEGEGPNLKYSVTERRVSPNPAAPTAQNLPPADKILPKVIIGARKHQIATQTAKIQQLEQAIPSLQSRVQGMKIGIEADMKALDVKAQELTLQLEKIRKDLKTLSDENIQVSEQITQMREQEIARRKDVTRLKALYDVTLTEKTRLEAQRTTLQDTLYRLSGTLDALERRNGQFRQQLGLPPRDEEVQGSVSEEGEI